MASVGSSEVKYLIQTAIVESMQEMCRDHERRKQEHAENPDVLSEGIYYPHEFAEWSRTSSAPMQRSRHSILQQVGSLFHGYAPSTHFTMKDGGFAGKRRLSFYLKSGVLPSEALHAIRRGYSIFGCGEVCHLAQYAGIQKVLNDKVDAYFSTHTKTPLAIGQVDDSPLIRLRNYILLVSPCEEAIQLGDIVSFENAPIYHRKHFYCVAQNYNTVCVDVTPGKQRFAALGFPPEGLLKEEIVEQLRQDFNTDPIDITHLFPSKQLSEIQSHLDACAPYRDLHLTPEEFKALGGGKMTILSEVNASRVEILERSSIADGLKYLEGWKTQKISRKAHE